MKTVTRFRSIAARLAELSRQAVTTILGVNILKVAENIFEHNDGPVFGHTKEDKL